MDGEVSYDIEERTLVIVEPTQNQMWEPESILNVKINPPSTKNLKLDVSSELSNPVKGIFSARGLPPILSPMHEPETISAL